MSGFRLGRIFGIDVRVHGSWFIIALLVMWTLAAGAIPMSFPALGMAGRLVMAAVLTLLFFLSLLAHELAHSVVAMARGIPVHRITFFLFGGMAQTSTDSRTPGEEFAIAIAGPLMSFFLAALGLALWWAGAAREWPPLLVGGAMYVGGLNLVLGTFNLIPGFPMDGGRVLRAAIWKATGSVTRATRWASRVGEVMAVLLMGFGLFQALTSDLMGGLWLVFIGLFIRNAARMSYRQHLVSRLHDVAQRSWEARYHRAAPPAQPSRRPTGPGGTAAPVEELGTAAPLTGRDVTGLRSHEA